MKAYQIRKMQRLSLSYWKLSARDKFAFGLNFILCGVFRFLTLTLPLSRFVRYFGQFHQALRLSTLIPPMQLQRAIKIGRMVKLSSKYTPWESNCLTQALIAKMWCQYYKIPHLLYLGFAQSREKNEGLKGHVWLTSGPVNITGGDTCCAFTVVSTYLWPKQPSIYSY